jgi:hypothetical protein
MVKYTKLSFRINFILGIILNLISIVGIIFFYFPVSTSFPDLLEEEFQGRSVYHGYVPNIKYSLPAVISSRIKPAASSLLNWTGWELLSCR